MHRYVLDPAASQVWITGSSSVHPINATATGLEGWLDLPPADTAMDTLGGEIRIDVERLRSGNSLVDRETRRRIDAGRFPEIVGTVTSAASIAANRLRVSGAVAFRGERREVEGELSVRLDGDRLVVEGSQRFDVRDWGLEPPRLALFKVHPDVEVRVSIQAWQSGRPEPTASS